MRKLTITFEGGQVGHRKLDQFEQKNEPAETAKIERNELIAIWEDPKDETISRAATLFNDEPDAVLALNLERLE
jgi:hypothetical protein